MVTSTQRIHTPWRRSQQQRFDPNREVIKLKFKVWNTVQRTYSKYYVDYRSQEVVGLADLREIALREVRRMVDGEADVSWFPKRNGVRQTKPSGQVREPWLRLRCKEQVPGSLIMTESLIYEN